MSLKCDVMAARALEPCDVPGVLDPPFARRHEEAADQRVLAPIGHEAEPRHPIGMQASAGKRPASIDAPSTLRRLGRTARRGRAGQDSVWAVAIDLIVGLPRQQGRDEIGAIADHHCPADRAVNPCKGADDLQRHRQFELQPAMAARYEQAKGADRPQRLHQIDRDAASGFELGGTLGDRRCEDVDVGEQALRRREMNEVFGRKCPVAHDPSRDQPLIAAGAIWDRWPV